MNSLLGIIPARSGSKGIPNKNIKFLGNKPLLQYTIDTAINSKIFDDIILTTDSKKIETLGKDLGLENTLIRPSDLAMDETPMLPVINHAIDHFKENKYNPYYICILQPTSPFRRIEDLVSGYNIISKENCDSVVSVVQVPDHYSPEFLMRIDNNFLKNFLKSGSNITRRQDVTKAYSRNGDFYFTKTDVVVNSNSIYGKKCRPFIIAEQDSVNLDTMEDWYRAEEIILRKKKGKYEF